MIPWFEITRFTVGGVTVHVLGLSLILSAATAYFVFVRRAVGTDVCDHARAESLALLCIVAGALGGHLEALVRGTLFPLADAPISSVYAGTGAIVAAAFFIRLRGLPIQRTMDALAYAFPFSFLVARTGCALTHDHLGIRGTGVLAVRFPDGPRYDPALLEALGLAALALVVYGLGRRTTRPGALAVVVGAGYALLRFIVDLLRATDPRWSGLTLAQWASLLLATAAAATAVARAQASRGLKASR